MRPWMKITNCKLVLLSILLTCIVIGNAFRVKKQFYPSVVYLTRSSPSMLVLYSQGFILVFLIGKLMRKIFFGSLRPVEIERLTERAWYALTETCLAFTIFRDDFTPKFVALFTLLLFLKAFHWLADERVDFMERSPVISVIFHVRIFSLLILLGAIDFALIASAYNSTMKRGPSVQMIFGFEYSILLTVVTNILVKYISHVRDLHHNNWENKAVFILYTDLVIGFLKLILYIAFIVTMFRIYTLPLFALRPLYYTLRTFKKTLHDVIMSRRALKNLSNLYPDATREELEHEDVCIICREELQTNAKKLPCNHIFHTSCLRSWFQRQQTCPTCRFNILVTPTNVPPPRQRGVQPDQHQPEGQFQQPQPPPQHPPNATYAYPYPMPPPNGLPHQTPPYTGRNFPYNSFLERFPVPPPMPPPPSLTEEEVRLLEQNTLEGFEARMKCLQNIVCMMDASLIMMAQYYSALAATHIDHPPPSERRVETQNKEVQVNSTNDSTDSLQDGNINSKETPPSNPGPSHSNG